MQSELLAAWLLTLALHAGVLLAIAWIVDRGVLRTHLAWREVLWRVALFGGVLTATAQVLLEPPTSARFALPGTGDSVSANLPVAEQPHDVPAVRGGMRVENVLVVAGAGGRVGSGRPATIELAAQALPRPYWRPSWQLVVLAGWLAGVLLMLVRLATAWLRLERMLARVEPLHHDALAIDAQALAIQARIDSPRLTVLDELTSPIAALGGRIVLPRWALDLLDREQLRAMLAHETAHLARRDPAWKLALALRGALLWFLPLSALARRRLDEVAELSCDAWAARHLGDGRALAECLAECAERRAGGIDIELAPAMAHRDSPLLQRIDHLIEGLPMNMTISPARAAVAAVLALALAAAVLPGFGPRTALAQPVPPPAPAAPSATALAPAPVAPPAPPAPPVPPRKADHHVHVSSDFNLFGARHQYTRIEVADGARGYRAKIKGEVTFNERDDDIATLSDGGSASFGETQAGSKRRIDYAGRGGRIEQHYFVDDREQPIDAAARAWIAGLIPVVIRETALDAAARVKRLHASGGIGAVLDEIARIDSGYARGVYLKELAALGKLTPAEVTRVLNLIDGIDSDFERRNALAALAAAEPLDAAQQTRVIEQAARMESDYERTELLVGLLPKLAPEAAVRAAWLRAVSATQSDYEHRRALSALLEAGHYDDATLAEVIGAAKSIHSDYERRTLLIAAVRRIDDAERIAPAYTAAVADIGSDYERREALLALIRAPKFGAAGAGAALDVAGGLGSDYECREVLVALAKAMPNDAGLIERYRAVARRLSDFERGSAERALDRFASSAAIPAG